MAWLCEQEILLLNTTESFFCGIELRFFLSLVGSCTFSDPGFVLLFLENEELYQTK